MKLKLIAIFMAAAITLSFTGCLKTDKAPQPEDPEQSDVGGEDNLEYPVNAAGTTLDSRPGIAVSLSPALTEKIKELGFDDRLEGVSDYCKDADGKILCGTAKAPDLEAIREILPHLLLTETELLSDDMDALSEMGVAVAVIPHAGSVDALMQNYKDMAMLFDGSKTGAAYGDAFNKKLSDKLAALSGNALTEPKNAVYLRLLDFTVATGDTLESELMELAGFNNIAKQHTGWSYPADAAADGKADFESLDFIFCDRNSVTIKMLEQSAYYKGLNAVRKDYYLYIDATAFEYQTLRMFDELERMQQYAKGEIEGGASQEKE